MGITTTFAKMNCFFGFPIKSMTQYAELLSLIECTLTLNCMGIGPRLITNSVLMS